MNDFNFDFNMNFTGFGGGCKSFEAEPWYMAPKKHRDKNVAYKHASSAADKIDLSGRNFAFVSGSFIFGDLIEALFVNNDIETDKLRIMTLSMSQDNVDSLCNLMEGGFVNAIDLVVSDYFFSHERNEGGLVPYLYATLGKYDFQLSVARTHCKVLTFTDDAGRDIVIHGSANLRSSDNIEQVCVENNKDMCEYVNSVVDSISQKGETINKSLRGEELWQLVVENQGNQENQ